MSDTGISGGPDIAPERPPTEGEAEPAGEAPSDDGAGRGLFGFSLAQIVLIVAAVLGIAGTLVFFFLWRGEKDDDAREGDVRDAAEEFLQALFEFDGATINEDWDHLISLTTGDARLGAEQEFGSPENRQEMAENRVASRWDPRDVFVQTIDGNNASVFAVGDQTIANDLQPQPVRDQLRIEITFLHEDGEWKVSRIDLLQAPASAAAPDFLEPNLPDSGTTTTVPG